MRLAGYLMVPVRLAGVGVHRRAPQLGFGLRLHRVGHGRRHVGVDRHRQGGG